MRETANYAWEVLKSALRFKEITAPSAGQIADNTLGLYAKDKAGVSHLYYKDDADVEHDLIDTTSAAPIGADYLVGTANGDLTAEIVVGTTPGGELGGTWASPTVDATHSGSAHHAAATEGVGIDITGQVITVDLSEIAAGGELGGFMDAPTVDTTHSGSSHAGAAAAETVDIRLVDVLVGTANAAFSGEIVVGTTPGGELGGTWASPTVDATHSGSVHHAAVTLGVGSDSALSLSGQELTLADVATQAELNTHAGAVDPHSVYRLESADHTHQSTGLQAGQLDHGAALTGLTDDDHTQYVLRSILTTRGDLYTRDASVITRLAVGNAAGKFLRSDATDPVWSTLILPNAITANNIVYASATDTYGQSTNLTFDGTDFLLGSGIRARMVGQNRFRHLNSMAHVYQAAAQNTITVNVWTALTFGAELFDTDGLHDNVTNPTRLTLPLVGKWLISGALYNDYTNITTPAQQGIRIHINGGGGANQIAGYNLASAAGSTTGGIATSAIIVTTATTDYVELAAIITGTGGTWDAANVATGLTNFSAAYLGE